MRKDARLERRLADVAALQKLKTNASRAEFGEAQLRRSSAETEFTLADRDFEGGMRTMEALLTADVLDFDRWRIGRAVVEELSTARDAAANKVSCREHEEADAQEAFGQEKARESHAGKMHRALVRRLEDRRDDKATLEANDLVVARKLARQS